MDFNVNIKKIGQTQDIFGFYKYMSTELDSKNHVLLESVAEHSEDMLFSFIGIKPDFMVKVIGDELNIYDVISERGEKMREFAETTVSDVSDYEMPFQDDVKVSLPGIEKLQKIFPISRSAMPELFPRKVFSGGLLGYIGYDVVADYVGYTPSQTMQDMFPDIVMGFFSKVLAYSHTTNTLYQIDNTIGTEKTDDGEISNLFNKYKSNADLKSTLDERIQQKIKTDRKKILSEVTGFTSNTSEEKWADMVGQTKEHINAGDIVQTVISRKMLAESKVDPLDIYQSLKILNPSPYMFHMNFENAHNGDVRIIGSSPEALIRKEHTYLETHPIAGTRRRGKDPEDEAKMEYELLHSEKELAEHIMLVDLARNDLAKVSVPGTVDTFEMIKLKKFPNIMHLVSKVRSTSHLDMFEIFKSVFPAGTVSGAPKRRAMEIIQDLEVDSRGPYAGSVGYFGFNGDMDMAISIRTIFNQNQKYIAQAGAGIVADSKAEEEYLETANKMKGALSTIYLAENYLN